MTSASAGYYGNNDKDILKEIIKAETLSEPIGLKEFYLQRYNAV
jgi:hypothetical protein